MTFSEVKSTLCKSWKDFLYGPLYACISLLSLLLQVTTNLGAQNNTFIILQLWSSEVSVGSRGGKFKVSAGLCSFGRLWGEFTSLPFPAPRRCLRSLAHALFLHLESQQCSVFESLWLWHLLLLSHLLCLSSSCLSLSFIRTLVLL